MALSIFVMLYSFSCYPCFWSPRTKTSYHKLVTPEFPFPSPCDISWTFYLIPGTCSSLLSIPEINTRTKSTLRREEWTYLVYAWFTVHREGNQGRNLEAETEVAYWLALHDLLGLLLYIYIYISIFISISTYRFIDIAQSYVPGWHCPQWSGPS